MDVSIYEELFPPNQNLQNWHLHCKLFLCVEWRLSRIGKELLIWLSQCDNVILGIQVDNLMQ